MNARVVFVLGALLAGCQPIAPGPARYSCSRELPAESQCVNGWRCGLDGFCFDPAGPNAVTLSCEVPETDCPTGWKCSLEGTCFDPAAPGAAALRCTDPQAHCPTGFRCSLNGACFDPANPGAATLRCSAPQTHCPTGWKCSLEGTCFDPAVPSAVSLPCSDPQPHCPTGWKCGLDARCLAPDVAGPWRCEDTARDCTGGWTCGAEGRCFDRADAGRVSCRADVATDCNEAWRCGIDGLCQQRDAGFPWPCQDDSHCEAAWRCGQDGRCLDPSVDALRPHDGMPQGVRFDLGWPAGVPDEVVLSDQLDGVGCEGWGETGLSGAARFGNRVALFAVASRGGRGLPQHCDGGEPTEYGPLLQAELDLSNTPPLELAQLRGTTMVRVDGGVRRFKVQGQQQVKELTFTPGAFKRLRTIRTISRALVFGDQNVSILDTASPPSSINIAPLVAVDGGTATIADTLIIRTTAEDLLLAATDQGLFAKAITSSDAGWTHVAWSAPRTRMQELRLAPQLDGGAPPITALVRDDTGTTRAWTFFIDYDLFPLPRDVVEVSAPPQRLFLRDAPTQVGLYRVNWAENYVFCPGDVRGWLHAVERQQTRTRVLSLLQCGLSDGGTELRRTVVEQFSSANIVAPVDHVAPLTSTARWLRNDDRTAVLLDEAGGVSLASTQGRNLVIDPWVPLATPRAVTGRVDEGVTVRTAQADLFLGDAVPQATTRETHFVSGGDAGALRVDTLLDPQGNSYRLVAGVEGRADLSVIELTTPQGRSAVLVQADDAGVLGYERYPPVWAFAKASPSSQQQVASLAGAGDGGLWFISVADQLHFSPLGAPYPVRVTDLGTFPDLVPLPSARLALTPQPGAVITHLLALPADAASGASYGQALVVAAGRLFHVRAENPVVWRSVEPLTTPAEIVKSWADGARVRIGDRDGRVTSFPSRVALSAALGGAVRAWDYTDVCGVTYALASDGLWRLAARAGAPIGTWTRVPLPGGFTFARSGALYTDGASLLVFDERGRSANVTALTCAQPL